MTWQKINDYYATNGAYTMTFAKSPVPKPYALHKNGVTIGFYATSKEANEAFKQIEKSDK